MFFDIWTDYWDEYQAFWQLNYYKPILEQDQIKAIGLTIWPCTSAKAYNDTTTIQGFGNGTYDKVIQQQAIQVKDFGYPVFIRFGAEFNINQGSRYSNGSYSFGKDPSVFVSAWKQYVDIFREEGAENAIFVWDPNCVDIGPHSMNEYYPGNAYVDWVGIRHGINTSRPPIQKL